MPSVESPAPIDKPTSNCQITVAPHYWLFRQVRKLVVAVLGISVLLVGIVMLVAPGPAVVVIPCGLAILATEFVWAKRLLNYTRKHAGQIADRFSQKG
jgi:tellurite resistance protein TerC